MGTERPVKRGSDGAEETVLLHLVGGVAEEQEGVTDRVWDLGPHSSGCE